MPGSASVDTPAVQTLRSDSTGTHGYVTIAQSFTASSEVAGVAFQRDSLQVPQILSRSGALSLCQRVINNESHRRHHGDMPTFLSLKLRMAK